MSSDTRTQEAKLKQVVNETITTYNGVIEQKDAEKKELIARLEKSLQENAQLLARLDAAETEKVKGGDVTGQLEVVQPVTNDRIPRQHRAADGLKEGTETVQRENGTLLDELNAVKGHH
jgi:uncharacterized protein YdbL (DUF1318 family)